MEAETNHAFVGATDRLIIMADHTKWNITGLSTIAPLDAADTMITDTGISTQAKAILAEHVEHIVTADPLFNDNDATMTELRRRA
jgi:DeoR/GlpR family transcriptional regulator of sugar metabolism